MFCVNVLNSNNLHIIGKLENGAVMSNLAPFAMSASVKCTAAYHFLVSRGTGGRKYLISYLQF